MNPEKKNQKINLSMYPYYICYVILKQNTHHLIISFIFFFFPNAKENNETEFCKDAYYVPLHFVICGVYNSTNIS